MPFPQPKGAGRPGDTPGTVDYRLDRRRLLRSVRAGEVGPEDVCDAHPELLRVGREYSRSATTACPICGEWTLRQVRFVFGPRLPSSGRCITSAKELERLAARAGEHRCYLVEVCVGCRWNHLLSSFVLRPTA